MYKDTPEFMYPAAQRSVLAAIEYLVARGVLSVGDSAAGVQMDAEFRRA